MAQKSSLRRRNEALGLQTVSDREKPLLNRDDSPLVIVSHLGAGKVGELRIECALVVRNGLYLEICRGVVSSLKRLCGGRRCRQHQHRSENGE